MQIDGATVVKKMKMKMNMNMNMKMKMKMKMKMNMKMKMSMKMSFYGIRILVFCANFSPSCLIDLCLFVPCFPAFFDLLISLGQ